MSKTAPAKGSKPTARERVAHVRDVGSTFFKKQLLSRFSRRKTPQAQPAEEPLKRLSPEREQMLEPVLNSVSDLYFDSQRAAAVAAADDVLNRIVPNVPVLQALASRVEGGDASAVQEFHIALSAILKDGQNSDAIRTTFQQAFEQRLREAPVARADAEAREAPRVPAAKPAKLKKAKLDWTGLLSPLFDVVRGEYPAKQGKFALEVLGSVVLGSLLKKDAPLQNAYDAMLSTRTAASARAFEAELSRVVELKDEKGVEVDKAEIVKSFKDGLRERVEQSFSYRLKRSYDHLQSDPLAFRGMVGGLAGVVLGYGAVAVSLFTGLTPLGIAGIGAFGAGGIIAGYSARHFRGERNLREREADVDLIVREFGGYRSLSRVKNPLERLALLNAAEGVLHTLVEESERSEDKSLSKAFEALSRDRTPENVGAFMRALADVISERAGMEREEEMRAREEMPPLEKKVLFLSEIRNMFDHDLRVALSKQASRRAEFVRAVRITTGLSFVGLGGSALLAGAVSPWVGGALVAGGAVVAAWTTVSRGLNYVKNKIVASYRSPESDLVGAGFTFGGLGVAAVSVASLVTGAPLPFLGVVSGWWLAGLAAAGLVSAYHGGKRFRKTHGDFSDNARRRLTGSLELELSPLLALAQALGLNLENAEQKKLVLEAAKSIRDALMHRHPSLAKAYSDMRLSKKPKHHEHYCRVFSSIVEKDRKRITPLLAEALEQHASATAKKQADELRGKLDAALKELASGFSLRRKGLPIEQVNLTKGQTAELRRMLFEAVNNGAREDDFADDPAQLAAGLKRVEVSLKDLRIIDFVRDAVREVLRSRTITLGGRRARRLREPDAE